MSNALKALNGRASYLVKHCVQGPFAIVYEQSSSITSKALEERVEDCTLS